MIYGYRGSRINVYGSVAARMMGVCDVEERLHEMRNTIEWEMDGPASYDIDYRNEMTPDEYNEDHARWLAYRRDNPVESCDAAEAKLELIGGFLRDICPAVKKSIYENSRR